MLRQAIVDFCCWAQHWIFLKLQFKPKASVKFPKQQSKTTVQHWLRTHNKNSWHFKHEAWLLSIHTSSSSGSWFPFLWPLFSHFFGDHLKAPFSRGHFREISHFRGEKFHGFSLPRLSQAFRRKVNLMGGSWLVADVCLVRKIRGWMMVDTTAYYRTTPNPTTNRIESIIEWYRDLTLDVLFLNLRDSCLYDKK